MTSVQGHAAAPSSGQGLYVYRGRNPIAPEGTRTRMPIDTSSYDAPRSRSIPQCGVCSQTGEKLVGGWWCSACESPIA